MTTTADFKNQDMKAQSIAHLLPTQQPRVRISAFPIFSEETSTALLWTRLYTADRTHLILAGGKLVLPKIIQHHKVEYIKKLLPEIDNHLIKSFCSFRIKPKNFWAEFLKSLSHANPGIQNLVTFEKGNISSCRLQNKNLNGRIFKRRTWSG